MPAMANFVAKSISLADVTFVALTPSGGDGTTAVWRVADSLKSPTLQTQATLKASPTADKKGRRCIYEFVAHYTSGDVALGTTQVLARMPLKLEIIVPLTMPAAIAADYACVALNSVAATLIRDSIGSGYAPR